MISLPFSSVNLFSEFNIKWGVRESKEHSTYISCNRQGKVTRWQQTPHSLVSVMDSPASVGSSLLCFSLTSICKKHNHRTVCYSCHLRMYLPPHHGTNQNSYTHTQSEVTVKWGGKIGVNALNMFKKAPAFGNSNRPRKMDKNNSERGKKGMYVCSVSVRDGGRDRKAIEQQCSIIIWPQISIYRAT